jgi:hypothetical protein
MKRRFKVKYPELITKFVESPRNCDSQGRLQFTWEEILMIARATGLKSKKRRQIQKRFQLVMREAVAALLDSIST